MNGTEYVFDLQEDPHEMINLAESAQPELQEEICNMRQYLIQQFKHRPGDGLLNPRNRMGGVNNRGQDAGSGCNREL